MESYILGIGKQIRDIRKTKNILATDLARRANVSNGLISRIENGRTVPSVPVLFSIIQALGEQPADFFVGLHHDQHISYVVIRAHTHQNIEKETEASGFLYQRIFGKQFSSEGCEFVLLTLAPGCKRDLVQTDAFEFKYVISGSCKYRIGKDTVTLHEGDSIFFDGKIPHVPLNETRENCLMLVVYMFT